MRRFLALIISVLIFAGQLSIISVASYDVTDSVSLDNFVKEYVKLTENISLNGKADKYLSSNGNTMQFQNDEENEIVDTNYRLIVKSSEKLNILDSVGYIYGYNNLHILQFADKESMDNAKSYYSTLSCVEYVEYDSVLSEAVVDDGIVLESVVGIPTGVQSNLFGYTSAKESSGSNPVDVAVIDSGVQYDHDFLKGRVVDTGFDAISNSGTSYDDRGHGTHVAGIVVANTRSNVSVYSYKVLNSKGEGTATQVSLGVDAAIEDGVDIINLSIQMSGFSNTLYDAVLRAYNAGITVVVAAGNKGVDLAENQYSPGCFPEAISVMSCSNSRRISSFSNYGTPCDFAAPGENILSTYINNTYKITSGTSMAAPFICAAAAYELSKSSSLSPDGVFNALSEKTEWCYGSHAAKCVYPAPKATVSGNTATPVFEIDSCDFLGSMRVTLSCETPGADIFYAFDSEDVFKEYTAPFNITSTQTINAYAVANGKYNSGTATAKYTLVNGNAADYIVDDNETLVGYNGTSVSVNVPSFVDGKRINKVASSAFSNNKSVTNIVFDKSLQVIGKNAFVGCDKLTQVKAPNCITIEDGAFKSCVRFNYFTSNYLETVGNEAFCDCPVFTGFSNANFILSVGDGAFENTEAFTYFPASRLNTIGDNAFKNSKITSLDSSSAISIGDYAFYGCDSLTTAILSSAITIGDGAFENCVNITTITAPLVTELGDNCFKDCVLLKTTQFGELKIIGAYAFYNCPKISSFNFNGVETIKAYAFSGASFMNVQSDTINHLESFAFSNCKNLTIISLNKLENIDFSMFEGADSVKKFYFDSAKSLVVPEGGIGSVCSGIVEFKAPLLTALPDNAFLNCSELETVSLDSLTSVGDNGFKGSGLTSVSFSNLTEIGSGAFSDMKKLVTVKLSLKNIDITTDMFVGDTAVKTVEFNRTVDFPDGLYIKEMFPNITSFKADKAEELPARMFADCTSLNSINLPELYTLGDEVFQNCDLTNVSIYADDIGVNVFDGNPLTSASFDYLETIDCDIFGSSKNTLKELNMKAFTDPNGFTLSSFKALETVKFESLPNVPHSFFANCTALETVELESALSIGTNVFYNCKSLKSFTAEALEEIDFGSFDGCDNLTSLYINSVKNFPSSNYVALFGDLRNLQTVHANSVAEIPANTFNGCLSLADVSFRNATKIGDYAFRGTALTDYTFGALTHIGQYAFSGSTIGSINLSTVKEIGVGAFNSCKEMQGITLSGITEIPDYAFYNCTNLKSAYFGDISSIGKCAFAYCDSMTSFSYNNTPVEIMEEAFYDCGAYNALSKFKNATSIGSNAFYGTKQSASSTYELKELKSVKPNAFEGVVCNTLILENVEEIYDVPEGAMVFIGTDVKSGAISNNTTATIYSPKGSLVSDYCIANNVNYVEFNETSTIETNTPKYSVGYGTRFIFRAKGFNITYNWYGCNKEDGSDAVLIETGINQIAPFNQYGMDFNEWDYKYIFCIAQSNENGNIVNIKSNMIRNTFTYVNTTNTLNEIWYNGDSGYIYSGEKSIDDFYSNMYFEEGACEFVPSLIVNNTKLYGTGAGVNVFVNNELEYTYTLVLDGDVNGDGYIDVLDCSLVASAASGKTNITDENQLLAATWFDGDYDITAADYQAIVNKALS